MELQGLQEALKVEIQCHQDGQLTAISALGDTQTLVKPCPRGASKPLALLRPPAQSISISVVPTKVPVSMVTAHLNGPNGAGPEALQTSPGRARAVGAGPVPFTRRAPELGPSQVLASLAPPLQGSQLSSLTGPAAALLPQVRKPLPLCLRRQPPSLQRATAAVSPRSQGAALPPASSPHQQSHAQGHAPSGSADQAQQAAAEPGVAYAIIAASPAPGNGAAAVSEAVKVIIIQAPGAAEGSASSQEPPVATPPSLEDQDPQKVAFMVALGLVTPEHLEEIQTRRQDRKRRSTANPAYSGLQEPERKRVPSPYLDTSLFLAAPDWEDFCWKEPLQHEDHCGVCEEGGELQPCHNCPQAFHPSCLQPPLQTPPRGPWYCPQCQKKVLNKEKTSWPHNFIQSYVTHKTVRQEEKRRLLRRSSELQQEQLHLEDQEQQLSDAIKRCMDVREQLLAAQRDTRASLERLRALVRLIRRHASRSP